MAAKSKSIKQDEVQQNPDKGIDRDFPGFPNSPSSKKLINPQTKTEKKTADVKKKITKKTYGK